MVLNRYTLLAIAAFVCIADSDQAVRCQAGPVTSPDSSPVEISQTSKVLEIVNVAEHPVVRIRFACAVMREKRNAVFHEFASREITLAPHAHLVVSDGQKMIDLCKSYVQNDHTSVIVAGVTFAGGASWPAQSSLPLNWAQEINGSPLKLIPTPSGYEVHNTSADVITGYRLGCVSPETGKLKILRRYPETTIDLEPGSQILSSSFDTPAPYVVQECVLRDKLKIAVIEVRFKDRATWQPMSPAHK